MGQGHHRLVRLTFVQGPMAALIGAAVLAVNSPKPRPADHGSDRTGRPSLAAVETAREQNDRIVSGSAAASHDATPEPELARVLDLVGEGFTVHRTGLFAIVTDTPGAVSGVHARVMAQTRTRFEAFAKAYGLALTEPRGPLICVLFSERDEYAAFAREHDSVDPSWIAGYYSIPSNRIVLYDAGTLSDRASDEPRSGLRRSLDRSGLIDRTIHETVHLLAFNLGVQSRRVRSPIWISEGLAAMFELRTHDGPGIESQEADTTAGTTRNAPGHRSGSDILAGLEAAVHRSRAELSDAMASGSALLDWERLVSSQRVPTGPGQIRAFYAQSAALCAHLASTRHGEFATYLDSLDRRPASVTHQAWFERTFGPVEMLAQELAPLDASDPGP